MGFKEITRVMSPNTMTKLHRDEQVMLNVHDNICDTLDCNLVMLWSMCRIRKGAIIRDR